MKIRSSMDYFNITSTRRAEIFNHIEAIENQKIESLSGGNVRLLETLILLFSEAKFLLLDEPFTGLSPIMVENLLLVIKSESKNKGIIISDHLYQNVLEISDRLMLLDEGRIKEIEGIDDLIRNGYANPSI